MKFLRLLHTVLDYETRSKLSIKTAGPWVYAQHESTSIVCAAYLCTIGDEAGKMYLYVNPEIYSQAAIDTLVAMEDDGGFEVSTNSQHLVDKLDQSKTVEAHNAEFERAITKGVLGHHIPINRTRCTAAECAAMSLPRKLEKVAEVLGLTNQKDMKGHRVMLKVARPRKPSKNNPAIWSEDDKDLIATAIYCVQDTRTEAELSKKIFRLSPTERRVWMLDQLINERGVQVDIPAVAKLDDLAIETRKLRDAEMAELTWGEVDTCGQIAKISRYIENRGYSLPDLQANTISDALKGESDMPADVRRVLELRVSGSKTSVKKLSALLLGSNEDGRLRSCFMYHGAGTGRWAGRRFQPQNLPRDCFLPDQLDGFLKWIDTHSVKDLLAFGDAVGDDLMEDISRCVRGLVIAADGKELICSDFKSVEGVVLAWVAGEEKVLQGYRNGLDPYKIAASDVFGVAYEDVDKFQRQIGKVVELACGFQGWVGAFLAMAATYGLPPMEEERILEIVKAWRNSRRMTVRFWWGLEKAVVSAIRSPGHMQTFRHIKAMMLPVGHLRNPTGLEMLVLKLPSGRLLVYMEPMLREVIMYGKPRDEISFMGVDALTRQWVRIETYGGKLTENVVQAIARDLLAEAKLRIESTGRMPIVFHVHDEAVAETDKGKVSFDEFNALMTELPVWANGMPISADGWVGHRYRKD